MRKLLSIMIITISLLQVAYADGEVTTEGIIAPIVSIGFIILSIIIWRILKRRR